MSDKIVIDPDDSVGAVKFNGKWRFLHDWETWFMLDYTKYYGDEIDLDHPRYGITIINENNAEEWMNKFSGEFTVEDIPAVVWESGNPITLQFVIDVDRKIWVGFDWKMDQSDLRQYQPDNWTAIIDNLEKHLPSDISQAFNLT